LINAHTLYRHLQFQAILFLVFGWKSVAFAVDTYCTCIADTCRSGACDYAACAAVFTDHPSLQACDNPIWLLQPLNDSTYEIQPINGDPFGAFKQYFGITWPWIIGSAAGIAVLWALVAGIEIMLSGGDSGKREKGKDHLLSALAGLLLIGLSGMILQILNPVYYMQ
jgi:hypothetical protein